MKTYIYQLLYELKIITAIKHMANERSKFYTEGSVFSHDGEDLICNSIQVASFKDVEVVTLFMIKTANTEDQTNF